MNARLARSACDFDLADVPARIREHTAMMLADTVAVIVAGAREPEVARSATAGGAFAEHGPSTVLTQQPRWTSPVAAAFLNGTAGTFLELDEGLRPDGGHPAIHVVPAALAVAQSTHASGRSLLLAFLSGYEVAARLFGTYRLRFPVHPHGHLGAVGAAVAVARLRGTDPGVAAEIASSLPLLTVWNPCFEGATVRNTYAGFAGAVGVLAPFLAASGFTGSPTAQATAFGELVGEPTSVRPDAEAIDPENLSIGRDYAKFFSACAMSHSTVEAALALRDVLSEQGMATDRIDRLEIETTTRTLAIDRQAVENSLSTRFSLAYAAATAIVNGHGDPAAFEPDRRVFSLAERVRVRANPGFDERWPEASPARITATVDGRRYCSAVENPRGHPARSLGRARMREKFDVLTSSSHLGDHRYRYDHDRLMALEDVDDVAGLFAPPG